MKPRPLSPQKLCRVCDPKQLTFETTDELKPVSLLSTQSRARDALALGALSSYGQFNIFVAAPSGLPLGDMLVKEITTLSQDRPRPDDIVYVNNFANLQKPKVLTMAAGEGRKFKALVDDIVNALADHQQSPALQAAPPAIADQAEDKPIPQNDPQLSNSRRYLKRRWRRKYMAPRTQHPMQEVSLDHLLGHPDLPKGMTERLQQGQRPVVKTKSKRKRLPAQPKPEQHMDMGGERLGDQISKRLQTDGLGTEAAAYVKAMLDDFDRRYGSKTSSSHADRPSITAQHLQARYGVNLYVDNAEQTGAPVLFETKPTAERLLGDCEEPHEGMDEIGSGWLSPGALHKAQGGYLIVNLADLELSALEALLDMMRDGELRPGTGWSGLRPDPVPFNVRVVLVGSPLAYSVLSMFVFDFAKHFKISAQFDVDLKRDQDRSLFYASLLADLVEREGVRPLHRGAVAALIDHSSRLISDTERLTLYLQPLIDLIHEADVYAAQSGKDVINADHITKAITSQLHRASYISERARDMVERDYIHIETKGKKIGQINGLTVWHYSGQDFGEPVRITARVRRGDGQIVHIHREIEMSGEYHARGAYTLIGYLQGQFATDRPLSLDASISFEQQYSYVDGDSASCAELYALLSAIAEIPIQQGLAVTGSVDQHGNVQAIGGVNQKIEGYFDICKMQGLTGHQGVLIPKSNAQDLMLRTDVVEAARKGKFAIYAVETINQGLEILTGRKATRSTLQKLVPSRPCINQKITKRLRKFSRKA